MRASLPSRAASQNKPAELDPEHQLDSQLQDEGLQGTEQSS